MESQSSCCLLNYRELDNSMEPRGGICDIRNLLNRLGKRLVQVGTGKEEVTSSLLLHGVLTLAQLARDSVITNLSRMQIKS